MSAISVSGGTTPPQRMRRRRGCLFFARRGLLLLVVIAVVGALYQIAATESDRRAYPPPGQMVAVGGHQMHILCAGEGSPTVILEAAGGHFSATWALVHPAIAQSTRVCAYDRAGYGWSEPGPEPRDAGRIATELHTLLEQARIDPPYVLVGHSVGGIYIRVYNAQYPGEAVGMALVDATHPDNWARQGESIETLQTVAGVSAVLARVGLARLFLAGRNSGYPQNPAALWPRTYPLFNTGIPSAPIRRPYSPASIRRARRAISAIYRWKW